MSSADVRDMLGIGPSQPPPPKRQKIAGAEPPAKKLDGIKRELYALLGDNTPPVAIVENKFKQRPNWLEKPAPWGWTPFKVDDGKVFYHWVRGVTTTTTAESSPPPQEEYSFAKFNIETEIPDFNSQEYDDLGLNNDDNNNNNWSFQETKYLFDLCREYNLRWIVIHDRYDFDHPTTRSLDDLRDQYYKVRRKLMEMQKDSTGSWTDQQQDYYNRLQFSKEKETFRKQYLENLYQRTPQEIAEEEMLITESQRLESSSKKMQYERQQLLKLLDCPVASGSIAQHETSQGLAMFTSNMLMADKSRKRRALGLTTESSTPPISPSSPPPPPQHQQHQDRQPSLTPQPNNNNNNKRAVALAQSQAIVAKLIPPSRESIYGLQWHDRPPFSSPGLYLRSSKLSSPKLSLQPKISHILAELGLPNKPVMPTAAVCAKFDQLQQNIGLMLDLKRQVDKQEADLKVLVKSTN